MQITAVEYIFPFKTFLFEIKFEITIHSESKHIECPQ